MRTLYVATILFLIFIASGQVSGQAISSNSDHTDDAFPQFVTPKLAALPNIVLVNAAAPPDNQTLECKRLSSGGIRCNDNKTYEIPSDDSEEDGPGSGRFYLDLCMAVGLTMLAGLMSGLTMGLMSIDTMNLQILINGGGTPTQQRYAKRIMPLVKRHHLLLVTLLVANAGAMEALPIFLDRIIGPVGAILISITCILAFGEVIPQALCTRYGLAIGANLHWLVWIIIVILFPIAWPISLLLDLLLGGESGTFFRRTELKELVNLHVKNRNEVGEDGWDLGLTSDEVAIIHGALDMTVKNVSLPMTPIREVFMLDVSEKLDGPTMDRMLKRGYSRIPVYRKHRENIMGMIIVKELIKHVPAEATPVIDLEIHRLPVVSGDMLLYPMLRLFSAGQSHMAVVVDPTNHLTVLGIITLEDVMEELIQQEITDETDNNMDTWSNAGPSDRHRPPPPPDSHGTSLDSFPASPMIGGLPGTPHTPTGMDLSQAITLHTARHRLPRPSLPSIDPGCSECMDIPQRMGTLERRHSALPMRSAGGRSYNSSLQVPLTPSSVILGRNREVHGRRRRRELLRGTQDNALPTSEDEGEREREEGERERDRGTGQGSGSGGSRRGGRGGGRGGRTQSNDSDIGTHRDNDDDGTSVMGSINIV